MEYQAIRTLKAQVEHVLRTRPETRNSDAEITTALCGMFAARDGSRYDPVKIATSVERCRRWFNQPPRLKYLPTLEEVARKRKMNLSEWRVAMGYPTASGGWTPPSESAERKRHRFPSETKRGIFYEVLDLGSHILCDCPSFQFRKKCRHVSHVVQAARLKASLTLF